METRILGNHSFPFFFNSAFFAPEVLRLVAGGINTTSALSKDLNLDLSIAKCRDIVLA